MLKEYLRSNPEIYNMCVERIKAKIGEKNANPAHNEA